METIFMSIFEKMLRAEKNYELLTINDKKYLLYLIILNLISGFIYFW